jgi:crossover junction endodeoxyribonuclease RuvC
MNVAGFDLSLTGTGVVVLSEKLEVLYKRTITTKLRDMERLAFIRGEIGAIVSQFKPSLACIEGYSMGSRAGQLASIGELGGVIKLLMHRNNFKYVIAAPTQVKKFVTGKGNSKKDEMMMAVFKRWGFEAKTSDEADAYGLARIALALTGHDVGLIQPQREVIDAIQNGKATAEGKAGQR